MKVKVYNRQKALRISKAATVSIVKSLLDHEKVSCDEVIIHFVDTKKICELHQEFFQDPTVTDCISFPIDPPDSEAAYKILGEVFVCTDTAIVYAKKHKLDPLTETTLYLVHGLLHLIGYDDLTSADRRVMRKKEKSCMEYIKDYDLSL